MNVRALALSRSLRARRIPPPTATPAPRVTYVICTTPRSGSWLLSDGLRSTALAGNPREWFNTAEEQQQRARWRLDHATDLTYSDYLRVVRSLATTRNGICGIKLHYYQFEQLATKLSDVVGLQGSTGAALLSRAFPNVRYLWLTRRDKVRQAISFRLAASTDSWWNITGDRRTSDPKPAEPVFDPHAIRRLELALADHESRWRSFFDANAIDPLVVHYEDLAADYRAHIVQTLTWLGIRDANGMQVPPPRLRQQSDARNEEWLRRFSAFKAALDPRAQEPDPHSVFSETGVKIFKVLPPPWKEWVVRQKLAGTRDGEIEDVLSKNGYDRELARAELARVAADDLLKVAAERHRYHRKAVALLNIQGQLAELNSRRREVERRVALPPDEFRDRYYALNRPLIVRGLLERWRARTEWTPDYLKRKVGDLVIEIMTGRDADPSYELNAANHRSTERFADYIDKVFRGPATNDYNLVANNRFFGNPATHALLDDLEPSLPYLKRVSPSEQCFLWFGPAGTVTPLHHDTSNILAAQIVGRKRYRLIPAAQWQYVYNTIGVFSDVDCEAPDLARYPLFRNVTIIDVVLEPGEVLFLPVGWWHHVRALDPSITVSFTNFAYPNHYTWEPRP